MAFLIIPVSDCLQKEPESMWLRLRQGGQWSPGVVGTCGSLQSPSISAQCPPGLQDGPVGKQCVSSFCSWGEVGHMNPPIKERGNFPELWWKTRASNFVQHF